MMQTPALRLLRNLIEDSELCLERLVSDYRNHERYDAKRDFCFHEYERAFKDNFVKDILYDVNENFGLKIEEMEIKSRKYYSRYDDLGRVKIYKKKKGKKRAKSHFIVFENLVRVNNLPTIIESCVGRFIPLKRMKRELGVMYSTFHNEFGYLIVSPPEYFCASITKEFVRNGGLIARFPLSKKEFRKKLLDVLREENFKIREEKENKVKDNV